MFLCLLPLTAAMTGGDRGRPKSAAAGAEAIAALSTREQVDALAQALLREFMHRRGYTRTLQTFDRECPRNERTIASRQLMRQLLEIPSRFFPSRLSGGSGGVSNTASAQSRVPASRGGEKEEAGADGEQKHNTKKKVTPTYMEELCSYRLQKREVQQRRQEEAKNTAASEAGTTVDPSDAEMEEWRAAAAQREQNIAEANERHERLLREARERKQRKRDKLKKRREREKKGRRGEEGEGSSYPHHSRHRDDRGENSHDGGDNHVVAMANDSASHRRAGRRLCVDDHDDDDDDVSMLSSAGFLKSGGLEEPKFLLSAPSSGRPGAQRPAGGAVGSRWTPCGGDVAVGVGVGRRTSTSPEAAAAVPAASTGGGGAQSIAGSSGVSGAEKPPAFLLGEDMSAMSERLRAAKRQNGLEDSFLRLSSSSSTSAFMFAPATLGAKEGHEGLNGSASFLSGPWQRLGTHSVDITTSTPLSYVPGVRRRTLSSSNGSSSSIFAPTSSLPMSCSFSETPPPQPTTGILKRSTDSRHSYDGTARPSGSAMRQHCSSLGKSPSVDGGASVPVGDGGEGSLARKNRKVTILMD